MKNCYLFFMLLCGLLLCNACNTDDDPPVNPLGNSSQVTFKGTIGGSVFRAGSNTWDLGDPIGVYALNAGGILPAGLYNGKENIKYTTPGTGVFTAANATEAISFPESGALDFVAYYPYQATITGYTYNINVANQSNSANIDLLFSNDATGATKANANVEMTFKHMLSMLVINVVAGDQLTSLDGLAASVKQLKTDGTFSLIDQTITVGSATGAITPAGIPSGASSTLAAILVPGQDLRNAKITFSLNGKDFNWTPDPVVLVSGKKYTYNIQLSATGFTLLNPDATITDWEEANTGTGIITLTPEGDTPDNTITVAALRAKYLGADVTIDEDLILKAVVIQNTTGGNSTSLKNIVVQDVTAGIAIRFLSDNSTLVYGDEVEISLLNQVLSSYNGLLQINNLVNANVTKTGTQTITARPITAAQLVTGDYESQYVAVADVQVVGDDLGKTFAPSSGHGTINMEAATGESFAMFTASFSVFKSSTVPSGSGTLQGIASINSGVCQILPTVLADTEGMTGTRFGNTLTVSPASIQFEAATGNTQTITVTASGAWTATTEGAGFTINTTGGTGNGTVTATASGDSGAAGKIIIALTGTALTKEVAVTQKNPVASGTVIFSDDFNDITSEGGNDTKWSGSMSNPSLTSRTGWTLLSAYSGYQCLKMGAGSAQGSAQTPVLSDLSGDAVLTFRAGAWNGGSEQTELLLEISGGGSLDRSSVDMTKGVFNEFTVNITNGGAATRITFRGKQASNARFFLDDVVVTQY